MQKSVILNGTINDIWMIHRHRESFVATSVHGDESRPAGASSPNGHVEIFSTL